VFDAADPSLEYELAWPRELFVTEATALLECPSPTWIDDAELLLEDAFVGSVPKDDLGTVRFYDLPPGLITVSANTKEVARAFVGHLVNSAERLPEGSERRPYWSARNAAGPSKSQPPSDRTVQLLQQDWAQLIEDLQDRGYFDWLAPRGCVVVPASSPVAEVLAAQLKRRLHLNVLWPLRHQDWDRDTFFSLIEVVHDLVARPRHRYRHDIPGCSWHYTEFVPTPGQRLYRWHVDKVMAGYGVDLQLAGDGEDVGRLVRVAGDDRDDLVEQVLQTPDPSNRDAVRHAIALFRSRGADRENQRSAVLALHRVLESRRPLIKANLMRRDEGALFQIANEFDLRHGGERQKSDYEDAYLDWVFWWYLATVELTNRLLARQADSV